MPPQKRTITDPNNGRGRIGQPSKPKKRVISDPNNGRGRIGKPMHASMKKKCK